MSHRSKLQSNIASSSGEADLNAAVKGIFEGIGVSELYEEMSGTQPKGMLLCTGAGCVKHLSAKQLWVQRAVQGYGMGLRKVKRRATQAPTP